MHVFTWETSSKSTMAATLYSDNFLNVIIEFLALENIYLDANIVNMCGLEAEI